MNPLTLEWIQKAEGDWTTALREYRARKTPNYEAAGFHAQQCAEKYLKARIQEKGGRLERTHDLDRVLQVLQPVPLKLSVLRKGLIRLTRFAVEVRYPGNIPPTKVEVRDLLLIVGDVRDFVRKELGLPALPDLRRAR